MPDLQRVTCLQFTPRCLDNDIIIIIVVIIIIFTIIFTFIVMIALRVMGLQIYWGHMALIHTRMP